MKIIFVLPDMPGGGTERVVSLLANEYVERGIEIAILLFAGNKVAYELDKRVEIISIAPESKGNIKVILKRLAAMRKYYKKNKYCRIYAFSAMGAVFSVIAAAGIPHYFLVSERNDPRRGPHRKWFEWAYSKADKVILQTPDVAELFSKKIVDKSVVIPNPINADALPRFTGVRRKTVVAVGRLEKQKNHDLLIRAFADFYKIFYDYELHIYGVGDLEDELKTIAQEKDIAHAVVLKGFCDDVKEEIKDAQMYVLSSDYEGISNSMLEAMIMGIPTIATDCPIGGSRMFIEDGVNGLLVPIGDCRKLSEAMIRIASNHELREKLSINGAKIKERCNLVQIADKLLEE